MVAGALAAAALGATPSPAAPWPSATVASLAALAAQPAACTTGDGVVVVAGRVNSARLFALMQGFANAAATSGGLGRRFLMVTRTDDSGATGSLRWAVEQARRDGGGWIGFAPQVPRGSEIALRAPLRIAANVTIDGGCVAPRITAPPRASILYVQRTANVVLTRLRLAHQGPAIDGKAGGDCITVSHGTDRVWIAYNDIGHCTDGQVDITQSGVASVMRVTVAHNHFHDHDKAMLVSGDDCRDTRTACAAVALTSPGAGVEVTIHDNVFLGTGQRHPRVSGRAFADVAGTVVAYHPQRRPGGTDGASYGGHASNGGRLLIRDSLYVALGPARAGRAVLPGDAARPGAVRTAGLVVLPATSAAPQSAPALVAPPRYRLAPRPDFAANPLRAAACVAAAAGPGGWDRAARSGC